MKNWIWGLQHINWESWALDHDILTIKYVLIFQGKKVQQHCLRPAAVSGGSSTPKLQRLKTGSIIRVLIWLKIKYTPLLCSQGWLCSRSWANEVCGWISKIAVLGFDSPKMNPGSGGARVLMMETELVSKTLAYLNYPAWLIIEWYFLGFFPLLHIQKNGNGKQ